MGTKWTTGAVNFDAAFADAVGFDPAQEYGVGTIWFGTPVGQPARPPRGWTKCSFAMGRYVLLVKSRQGSIVASVS